MEERGGVASGSEEEVESKMMEDRRTPFHFIHCLVKTAHELKDQNI